MSRITLKAILARAKQLDSSSGRKYTYQELLEIREREAREFSEQLAMERKENSTEAILGRSGIQPLHQSCTVENFEANTDDKVRAANYASWFINGFEHNQGGGFIFSGKPGTGKNHLASAICNKLMSQSRSCIVITITELMIRLRKCYGPTATVSEDQFIRSMINYDLLILDEVGLQRGTDNEKLTINQIVDQRLCNLRPTGMLTNLSAEAINEVLGVRIMDRMRTNNGQWIDFNWESYRK